MPITQCHGSNGWIGHQKKSMNRSLASISYSLIRCGWVMNHKQKREQRTRTSRTAKRGRFRMVFSCPLHKIIIITVSLLLPAGIVSTHPPTHRYYKEDEGQGQVGGRKNKWIAGVCVVESLHLIIIITQKTRHAQQVAGTIPLTVLHAKAVD